MALYQLGSTPIGPFIFRTSDGAHIPIDTRNTDYRDYLAWVAAGNTADPVPTAPTPTTISTLAFINRFTPTEQEAVMAACSAIPALGVGLTTGLATGSIELTGSVVATWMAGLVAAGAITSGRSTTILTP